MELTASVEAIPGIGSIMAGKLAKLDIRTVFDLLYHLPFRYEDRSLISPIIHAQPGELVTINATLDTIKNAFTQKGKAMQVAQVHDTTKSLQIIWFNQVYLTRTLKVGQPYSFYGKIDWFGKKLTMISPEFEQLDHDSHLHTGRIIPIDPETAGLSSKWLRGKIYWLLDNFDPIAELAPKNILRAIHFPEKIELVPESKKRLAFDELFLLQLRSLEYKQKWVQVRLAHKLQIPDLKLEEFIASWPFQPTISQNKAIKEILADLSLDKPMNRLLEGDVGSGKTIVAATAIYASHLNNYKSLVMAPTQILADQHYQTLSNVLKPFNIKVGLVTGKIKDFDAVSQVVVGTQALLSENFNLDDVALVIIDEQHKFGVTQRSLAGAKGISPHILTMTATPIPRTIALAMYGDLDLSTLTDLPSGRQPVKTWVVEEQKRQAAYEWIRKQHAQAFVVCPIIEESESLLSVKAVKVEYEKLIKIFPEFKIGLLHGRLKAKEKDEVLTKFRNGEIDILVSTPVVEVGIDIPNASIMVIEAAERFGLAQLHQLRGRVGRGEVQAYCLLFSESDSSRLKALETHHSGIALAEIDMQLRGPGNVFGTSQHGVAGFKIASFTDLDLMQEAKAKAELVLPQLPKLPHLRTLVEKDKIALIQPN